MTHKGAGLTRECCLDFIKREEECTAEREWEEMEKRSERNGEKLKEEE